MKNINHLLIDKSTTLHECLKYFDDVAECCLFVVDRTNRLLGSFSEGDLRRAFLKNAKPFEECINYVNENPVYFQSGAQYSFERVLQSDVIKGDIPVVDHDMVVLGAYEPDSSSCINNSARKMSFVSVAPTRVSFAGGGSDLADWFKSHSGVVVNMGINKYAKVYFEKTHDDHFYLLSSNLKEKLNLHYSQVREYSGATLGLVVECLKKFDITNTYKIEIDCEFEPGSGLGGSSALVVALLKGLAYANNVALSNHNLYKLAYQVERHNYGIKGGWQDHIAATFGGLLETTFSANGINVTKFALSQNEISVLENSLYIVPIGESRSSSEVHREIEKGAQAQSYIDNMNKIVSLARVCKNEITSGKIANLGLIMHQGWLLKRDLSSAISNEKLDNAYETLVQFGAEGGRLLGAGGSGYLLVFVPFNRQIRFQRECDGKRIRYQKVLMDHIGARIIGDIQ